MTGRNTRKGRPGFAGILAAVALCAFAVQGTAWSQTAKVIPEDKARAADAKKKKERAKNGKSAAGQRGVSRVVGGQTVYADPATGRLRPPTREEAQKLAEGLANTLSQSDEGLVVQQLPDGTLYIDLQDRYQDIAIATVGEDGKATLHCVNDAKRAEALLSPAAPAKADAKGGATEAAPPKPAPKPAKSAAGKE